jgi:hypothetical protein
MRLKRNYLKSSAGSFIFRQAGEEVGWVRFSSFLEMANPRWATQEGQSKRVNPRESISVQ